MAGSTDSVLVNLKILGKVPRNGRIKKNSNGNVTLEDDGLLVPLKRRLFQDNRYQAVADVQGIVNEAFHEIRTLLNSRFLCSAADDTDFGESRRSVLERLAIFQRELANAASGLENLKTTYAGDIAVVVHLDTVVEKIQLQLQELRRRLPDAGGAENSVDDS